MKITSFNVAFWLGLMLVGYSTVMVSRGVIWPVFVAVPVAFISGTMIPFLQGRPRS